MTEAVKFVHVHEPVTELLRLFSAHPIHHLPVVDERGVCGMLSSADLLKLEHFLPKAGHSGAVLNQRFKIEQIMRRPVTSIGPDEPISDAVSLMSRHAIHGLPVVDRANRLLGLVTTTDIMAGLLRRLRELSGDTASPDTRPTVGSGEPGWSNAINAARTAVAAGRDPDGIAAATLQLHHRNALLEALRRDVTRYLKFGEDSQLQARLLKELDQLDAGSVPLL